MRHLREFSEWNPDEWSEEDLIKADSEMNQLGFGFQGTMDIFMEGPGNETSVKGISCGFIETGEITGIKPPETEDIAKAIRGISPDLDPSKLIGSGEETKEIESFWDLVKIREAIYGAVAGKGYAMRVTSAELYHFVDNEDGDGHFIEDGESPEDFRRHSSTGALVKERLRDLKARPEEFFRGDQGGYYSEFAPSEVKITSGPNSITYRYEPW